MDTKTILKNGSKKVAGAAVKYGKDALKYIAENPESIAVIALSVAWSVDTIDRVGKRNKLMGIIEAHESAKEDIERAQNELLDIETYGDGVVIHPGINEEDGFIGRDEALTPLLDLIDALETKRKLESKYQQVLKS